MSASENVYILWRPPKFWPLVIFLASFPSPCHFHLPGHSQGIMCNFPGLQTLLGGMPPPCGYSWLQLSPAPFHSAWLNPIVPRYLTHVISSRNFSIISPNLIWKLFLPAFLVPMSASLRASSLFILSLSPQEMMMAGNMTVYFASPLPRTVLLGS